MLVCLCTHVDGIDDGKGDDAGDGAQEALPQVTDKVVGCRYLHAEQQGPDRGAHNRCRARSDGCVQTHTV